MAYTNRNFTWDFDALKRFYEKYIVKWLNSAVSWTEAQKKQARANLGFGDGDIDSEPTYDSDNLVRSCGVYKAIIDTLKYQTESDKYWHGTVGNLAKPYTQSGWNSAICNGMEGSVFEVCGNGGSAIRLWMTLDETYTIKRVAAASVSTLNSPIQITLASDEKYICMNSNRDGSYIALVNVADTSDRYIEYNKRLEIYRCNKSLFSQYGYLNESGVYVNSNNYLLTEYLPISNNDTIKCNIYHSTSGGTSAKPLVVSGGIYCYDKRHTYLGRYTITHNGYHMFAELTTSVLPSGTAYIRAIAKASDSDWYIYGVRDYKPEDSDYNCVLLPNGGFPIYDRVESNVTINTYLEELHTNGGGVLKLGYLGSSGLNGAAITLNYEDVSIEGSGMNVTILSGGRFNLVIGDGVTKASVSNLALERGYKCKKTCQLAFTNVRVSDRVYNGIAPSEYFIASSDSPIGIKNFAYDVIETTDNAASTINTLLSNYDSLYVAIGTYNTTATIIVNSNNRILRLGTDGRVTINRSTNGFTFMTANDADNTYIEHCVCDKNINLQKSAHNGHIVDCFFNTTKYIRDLTIGVPGINVIKVGEGYDIEKLSVALTLISQMSDKPSDVTYKIEIYGVVIETITSSILINSTVYIEGKTHDAEVQFTYNSVGSAIVFRDYNGNPNKSIIKNVKFSLYGTAGSYQYAVVNIRSNHCYFENCQFINRQNYSGSYDPETDTGNSALAGDRKHGCLIDIDEDVNVYDDNCHLELHNCVAEGSPYGNKNCRGFYIMKGSPKMYNCKGIGGGVGRYGYGIICHHSSKPYLYNCIGIGSPYGWEFANGIQFQMSSEAKLVNCIGFGGTGYKYKSSGNGVIVRQDEITGASHGFGFLMNVKPTLVNCMGYAGDGNNSLGLYASYLSKPDIVGGVFGKDVKMYCVPFAKDSGQTYMTLSIGNDYRNIELVSVGFRDLTGMTSGQKIVFKNGNGDIILEASEITQQQYATIFNKYITANDTITCRVIDGNGDDVTSTVNFNIIVQYMVSNSMSCVGIKLTASPHIHKALLKGNEEADGISIETSTNNYIIEGCTVETAATRYPVKSSTQRSNVNVVGCLFTSALEDENILSYATVIQKGSNNVIL